MTMLKTRPRREPKPLPALIPFVSVDNMMRSCTASGSRPCCASSPTVIEGDFLRWESFDKTARIPAHSPDGVIELMPTADSDTYGFKYVNGHPKNMREGLQTVTAFGLLADMHTGYPVLLSEMTLLTALRTAAMSALAAKHLAPKGARVMAVIGNGAQSEFQSVAFKAICGIEEVRLWDIDPLATVKAARNLQGQGLTVVPCKTAEEAILGAHVITTATADKKLATILSDNMVGPGRPHQRGGRRQPGKTELARDILLRADIFVEFPPQTRIEGEIQQLDPTIR
jgi:ornithine cyclodeaminase